jgi:hypothetical protein
MIPETTQQAVERSSFALPVRSSATRLTLFLNDRGVTLGRERIGWSIDGEAYEEPLANLSEIHLETDSLRSGLIPVCRLTFADGQALRVLAATSTGAPDGEQRRIYARFVRELHRRLGPEDRRRIAFGCGFAAGRVGVLRALAYGGVALTVALALLVPMGGFKPAVMAAVVGMGTWRLWNLADANVPRAYDPDDIPPEMLPE